MSVRILTLALAVLVIPLLSGCGQNAQSSTESPTTQPSFFAEQDKPGAQLWSENCSRCHNMRPPQSFSDAQWQTIVHHMRLRANLTGAETRKITEFLQASR